MVFGGEKIGQITFLTLWPLAIVSWRSSVSEDVWKGAPAPAFLRLHTTHTRNTQPHFGGGNLCLCAQYRQQLDMRNQPVIIKCRVL